MKLSTKMRYGTRGLFAKKTFQRIMINILWLRSGSLVLSAPDAVRGA